MANLSAYEIIEIREGVGQSIAELIDKEFGSRIAFGEKHAAALGFTSPKNCSNYLTLVIRGQFHAKISSKEYNLTKLAMLIERVPGAEVLVEDIQKLETFSYPPKLKSIPPYEVYKKSGLTIADLESQVENS